MVAAESFAQTARAQLERILDDERFRRGKKRKHAQVLKHLVELALENTPAQRYKEATVVAELYGKPDTSTLRVALGTIRYKLHEYYANEGASDLVVIDLPKGTLIPMITARAIEPARFASALETQEHQDCPCKLDRYRHLQSKRFAGI